MHVYAHTERHKRDEIQVTTCYFFHPCIPSKRLFGSRIISSSLLMAFYCFPSRSNCSINASISCGDRRIYICLFLNSGDCSISSTAARLRLLKFQTQVINSRNLERKTFCVQPSGSPGSCLP